MLHGEIKINGFGLVAYEVDNVNNTNIEPVVYEVRVAGVDKNHFPFEFDFQMIGAAGPVGVVIQLLEELQYRLNARYRDKP